VLYTPNPGFAGTDSFTFRAKDGQTSSLAATVTIDVQLPENAIGGFTWTATNGITLQDTRVSRIDCVQLDGAQAGDWNFLKSNVVELQSGQTYRFVAQVNVKRVEPEYGPYFKIEFLALNADGSVDWSQDLGRVITDKYNVRRKGKWQTLTVDFTVPDNANAAQIALEKGTIDSIRLRAYVDGDNAQIISLTAEEAVVAQQAAVVQGLSDWSARAGIQTEVTQVGGVDLLHVSGTQNDGSYNYAKSTGVIELTPGQTYTLVAPLLVTGVDPTVAPYFTVEFTALNADGSVDWNQDLGMAYTGSYDLVKGGWQSLSTQFTVPTNADAIWISLEKGSTSSATIDAYIDFNSIHIV
jgi:hypothetical protein